MNTDTIIALPNDHAEAGAIVWWSLSGDTALDDMEETLEGEGFDVTWVPSPPRIETIVRRAAQSQIQNKRQLVRPLKERGSLEFVTERVVKDDKGKDQLEYTPNVRVLVDRTAKDTAPSITVEPATTEDECLAEAIQARFRYYSSVMAANDISTWLVKSMARLSAVGLRDRGGFYFVPRGPDLDTFRRIRSVVEAVSEHRIHSMPAMHSDDAVEAILHAVRAEADAEMAEMETYLAGEVSTRGLNSCERRLAAIQAKTRQYAELLGVELPELVSRAEQCLGGLGAARMMHGNAGEAAE